MPYNPGVQDQSGLLLGRGIASAGQSIGAGLESFLKDRKDKADKAKSLRSALSVYLPDRKEEFTAMGLPELEGQVQGLQMQNQARQQQSQQTEQAAKMDLLRSQMVEQQQRVSDQQAAALSLQRMKELNGGALPADVQGPPRAPVDDMGTALRNAIAAGVAPRDLSELATASAHLQATSPDAGPLSFEEDPVSGERFARKKNTVLPSGVNPLKDFGRAEGLLDQNGNPTGMYTVRTAKGLQIRNAPPDRSAENSKANIGSLFEGEKLLRGLDDDIKEAEDTNAAIKKAAAGDRDSAWAKGRAPIPPERFDELKARRERVKKHLDALDAGAASVVPRAGVGAGVGAGAVGGGAPATNAARSASRATPEDLSRTAASQMIRRNPAARTAILQKLKAAGYSTEGL